MAPKGGPKVPKALPKRDHHMRAAYLYQAAVLSEVGAFGGGVMGKGTRKTSSALSRMYAHHLGQVSKKAVLKLHPDLKRSICKRCSRVGIPGINIKIRDVNESTAQKDIARVLEWQCVCGEVRRFPYGKNTEYVLYVDQEGKCIEWEEGRPKGGQGLKRGSLDS